jgi:hypothetical protein
LNEETHIPGKLCILPTFCGKPFLKCSKEKWTPGSGWVEETEHIVQGSKSARDLQTSAREEAVTERRPRTSVGCICVFGQIPSYGYDMQVKVPSCWMAES